MQIKYFRAIPEDRFRCSSWTRAQIAKKHSDSTLAAKAVMRCVKHVFVPSLTISKLEKACTAQGVLFPHEMVSPTVEEATVPHRSNRLR